MFVCVCLQEAMSQLEQLISLEIETYGDYSVEVFGVTVAGILCSIVLIGWKILSITWYY